MLTNLWSSNSGDIHSVVASPYNLTATTDPTASNDATQGYQIGSVWFNSSAGALRWWECVSNTASAAQWVFSGACYAAGGTNPSTEITQFGNGSGTFGEEGNLFKYASAGLNPGGTAADYVVAAYALPANSFDSSGRTITITANGGFASNTNTKRCKIIIGATTATVGSAVVGGTTIADTGNYATTGAVGWSISASVAKYGAAASNTQIGIHAASQMGATVGSLLAPVALTLTENAAVNIAITANAATAATDITLAWATINAMN